MGSHQIFLIPHVAMIQRTSHLLLQTESSCSTEEKKRAVSKKNEIAHILGKVRLKS